MSHVNPKLGLIVGTDASCIIYGQSWPGIPTLIWPDGIDEDASDWLRTLVVKYGVRTSSAEEYAKIVRPFLRFCRLRTRKWHTVDDDFLIVWREYLLRTLKLSTKRVNTSLETIFSFYRWAEETKRVRFHVGIYAVDQLPAALRDATFPITAMQRFSKGRHGRIFGSWTTPLLLSGARQSSAVRHTPTETEIQGLHEIAADRVQGERDSLIFSWAEEVGARRAEILSVCKSDMPDADELADIIEKDEPWIIYIERKGGQRKPLNVLPDLIIRTQDFVEFSRAEIVAQCRKGDKSYVEPEEIFLSSSTGMVLHPDTVTSIGGTTFRHAGIKNANVHRLRARFAVRTIEALVNALFEGETIGSTSSWVETILIKAAETMGHASPQSLRPYLNYVLNRRIQTADSVKAERLAARLRQMRLHEHTLVRRMGQHRELQIAAIHLQAGRDNEAAAALRKIADEIDR